MLLAHAQTNCWWVGLRGRVDPGITRNPGEAATAARMRKKVHVPGNAGSCGLEASNEDHSEEPKLEVDPPMAHLVKLLGLRISLS